MGRAHGQRKGGHIGHIDKFENLDEDGNGNYAATDAQETGEQTDKDAGRHEGEARKEGIGDK